jgi:hypothetical protein
VGLFEGSVVTLGMNENTPFLGMKSTEVESYVEELRRETEAVLKHIPQEEQYKIRQLITKHIALQETEPIKITPVIEEPQVKAIDWESILKQLK